MAKKGFVDFGLTGDKKLDKKLKRMDRRVAGKAIRGGMKVAMEPVLSLAKARAPVKTGRLKKSIRVAGYAGKTFAGAAVLTGTRKMLKIPATSKSYYPAYVEYGSKKIGARPFMRSAMADRRKQVLSRVSAEIKKQLESA